ncbi:unnamed protein product [Microthlaspi erraticum]|uniref:Uncharacterized protein n=1 Tax=Microthlaspi erraticum TaxID=1685480 RepID=A0A6D2LB93_9BRAS|nr:unnamed protein product [Microthlaspi erraticum]
MSMKECKSLKHVSLNISKLKRLDEVDFSNCGALSEVSLNSSPNGVAMATDNHHSKLPILDEASPSLEYDNIELNFTNCFNLNQKALIEKQTVLQEKLILPGEEVPSYFTYQTSETYPAEEEGTYSSLTIPLFPSFLLQPFFRIRVCVLVICDPISGQDFNFIDIAVNCRFKGRFGNIFESLGQPRWFQTTWKDSHLFILDCRIPLNKGNALPQAELNYDHVDIQLQISRRDRLASMDYTIRLKRWGVRILNDDSSAENRPGNPNALPHVKNVEITLRTQRDAGSECGLHEELFKKPLTCPAFKLGRNTTYHKEDRQRFSTVSSAIRHACFQLLQLDNAVSCGLWLVV